MSHSHAIAPGIRVYAIRNANKDEVHSYGTGVYAGDFLRPGWSEPDEAEIAETVEIIKAHDDDTESYERAKEQTKAHYQAHVDSGEATQEEADGWLAQSLADMQAYRERDPRERAIELLEKMGKNPRIDLDSGETVWGFQCWWGPEDGFEDWVAGRTVVNVSPE